MADCRKSLRLFFRSCDFIPAIHALSFLNMWVFLLNALRTAGLFQCAIIVNHAGTLTTYGEGVKLVATVLYYKDEANIKIAIGPRQQNLESVRGDASGYADVIRWQLARAYAGGEAGLHYQEGRTRS